LSAILADLDTKMSKKKKDGSSSGAETHDDASFADADTSKMAVLQRLRAGAAVCIARRKPDTTVSAHAADEESGNADKGGDTWGSKAKLLMGVCSASRKTSALPSPSPAHKPTHKAKKDKAGVKKKKALLSVVETGEEELEAEVGGEVELCGKGAANTAAEQEESQGEEEEEEADEEEDEEEEEEEEEDDGGKAKKMNSEGGSWRSGIALLTVCVCGIVSLCVCMR